MLNLVEIAPVIVEKKMKMWKVYNNNDKGQKLTGVFDYSGELQIQWHEVYDAIFAICIYDAIFAICIYDAILPFVFLYWMSTEAKMIHLCHFGENINYMTLIFDWLS